LRFSSKISGRGGEDTEEYIMIVARMARLSFGSRVQRWSEMFNQYGHYGWYEVYESIISYEQVRHQSPIAVSSKSVAACCFWSIRLSPFAHIA
jgi:hypothetical protein